MITERPRRNRSTEAIRASVRETHLQLNQLIYPLFVEDGKAIKAPIDSLPGIYRFSIDTLISEIEACVKLGISSFVLFPKVNQSLKDNIGSYGYHPDNFYFSIAQKIKAQFPDITLISDIALDPYNIDGHDGVVQNGVVDNDATLPLLAKMAVLQAEAGFDIVGPSDMMDGRVGVIREALNDAGYHAVQILSYTAKYASAMYGPFRDALDSAPVLSPDVPSDKKTYQMDPANKLEALIEAKLDVQEGADYIMVKPALHYLDIIHLLKENFDQPIAAYHVSGECAMLLAACQNGWLQFDKAMPETLLSIKRAGADFIISYFAKAYAKLLKEK